MGLLEDTLGSVNVTLRHTNTLLAHLYKQIQQAEADKTPYYEKLYTVNVVCPVLPNPVAWQMMPRNGARKFIALINNGPSDLLFSNKNFDPTTILQQMSDPSNPDVVLPSPLQMVEIGLLTSGGTVSLNSSTPLWVYNTTVANNLGALISIQEDVFTVPNKNPTPAGTDGRRFQGYTQIPGVDPDDPIQEVKALH